MRAWVTILAIALGVLVVFAVFRTAGRRAGGESLFDGGSFPDAHDEVPSAPGADAPPLAAAPTDRGEDRLAARREPPLAIARTASELAGVDPIPGLHVLPAANAEPREIGSVDPEWGYKIRLELTQFGAGVGLIDLADYYDRVDSDVHYVIHKRLEVPGQGDDAPLFLVYPFAARSIKINGTEVNLSREAWSVREARTTDESDSVEYHLVIADEQASPVVEIVRRYVLPAESYGFRLEQTITNRSSTDLRIIWNQYAQGDVVKDRAEYLGDRRTFVTGYFGPKDRTRERVSTVDALTIRSEVINRHKDEVIDGQRSFWPSRDLLEASRLVWVASENRYFVVVTHLPVTDQMQKPADVPPLDGLFPRVRTVVGPDPDKVINFWDEEKDGRKVVFTLSTNPLLLRTGETIDLSVGVYAGPRKKEVFDQRPFSILDLGGLVRYSLGGPCAVCTFQWLAKGLLGFLKLIYMGVFDWGVAIIILVAVVRLVLHPITKKAQVNMMKMGKQMQALQPEMEKLKSRYKDDQKKLNQEMMKLYREKGVNPANMFGCLPMFLQMPIWVALYAMLYFAIELRHEPAFYGVFQAITGGHWQFLADLSTADNFIKVFDDATRIKLPFIQLSFQSINILPVLMAVVFYFQQKFTTPPAANEQQAQQQKIMKFMMLLFPIFLYSAPSGLTLYILASTTAGIVDSYLVRKHVKEQEERGELFGPRGGAPTKERKPKAGGLMDRLSKAVEARRKQFSQGQREHASGRKRRRNRKH